MCKKWLCFIMAITLSISLCSFPCSAEETDGLVLDKSVTQTADENGHYTINLESYTTGTVALGGSPVDVLLVLDVSDSMGLPYNSSNETISKLDSIKTSVCDFLTELQSNAYANEIVHRVGIVTFGNHGAKVTEGYWSIDGTTSIQPLKDLVLGLKHDGETFPNAGMDKAKEIYDADGTANDKGRNQVVILFSDGAPSIKSNFTSPADKAIGIAKELKDHKATVYSVGIFENADPDVITGAPDGSTALGAEWYVYDKETAGVGNRFMNYFSSNSTNALGLGVEVKYGSCIIDNASYEWSNKGYFLTASDDGGLNQIFTNLSHEIVKPDVSLDETTQVCDYLSDYFELTDEEIADCVSIQAIPYQGNDSWGTPIPFSYVNTASGVSTFQSSGISDTLSLKYNREDSSVTVWGFAYDDHVVGTSSSGPVGYKLNISFTIQRKEHFIGGNDVPTNLEESGVYRDKNKIKSFEIPDTQVELLYEYDTNNQLIYRGNAVESQQLVDIDLSHLGFANDFVTLTYTLFDQNDTPLGSLTIPEGASAVTVSEALKRWMPTGDTSYRVECSVTPNTAQNESVTPLNQEKTGTIYVLQPQVATQDLWVDYGTNVSLGEKAVAGVSWIGEDRVPTGTYHANEGVPPSVKAVFEGTEQAITHSGNYPITQLELTSSDGSEQVSTMNYRGNIKITLNEYAVAITKTVSNSDYLHYPQSFLFEVEQNETVSEVVMVQENFTQTGNGNRTCTITVSGLYAGLPATITEDSDWSWRYVAETDTVQVNYANDPPISTEPVPVGQTTAAFKNELVVKNWLGDEDAVENKFAER